MTSRKMQILSATIALLANISAVGAAPSVGIRGWNTILRTMERSRKANSAMSTAVYCFDHALERSI
ncbi:hypothetical protein BH11CYA1_BH11CYA1_27250 [soil metagenome]